MKLQMNQSAAKTVVDFPFFYYDLMFTVCWLASAHPISSIIELTQFTCLAETRKD